MKRTGTLRTAVRNLILLVALGIAGNVAARASVAVVDTPPLLASNPLHTGNRAPLAPSPFIKLPIGSIKPQGWLRHQLELERDGMTGRLKEISPWLEFEKSSWTDKEGRGKFGWEEMPYWLKGYGDLGYVLKDDAIIAETKRWIEAAIASQREDGWFGPRELLTSLKGKPDLWPHMVMLNVLQSYYEFSGDPRVIEVMTRYFKWENQLPVSAFGEGYWPKLRFGDNIESAFWLYNRTGEPWLLDLAKKIHAGMARWDEDVVNWHNVNIAQGFRAGTVFGVLSGNPAHLGSAERNYAKVMDMYGQFPGGGFVGDENCRPGFTDPRGGFETCGWVEFMHSFEMLTKITGNPVWADRCEEIAFNSLPASMTADQKALHYITCANQVQLDQHNKSPGIENSGTMFSYSPFEVYRCCQHNVSHGWPYYAEELWLATPDNGLCASLYSASEVRAKVGSGVEVRIVVKTDYPFGETITFNVFPKREAKFPLYLRIPRWCEKPELKVNGIRERLNAGPSSFIVIQRNWSRWDTVTLRLPMRVTVRTWEKQQNAVSVNYGPLSFALAIKERWAKYGSRNAAWPEWEVFPDSPWNYGLVLDAHDPAKSFKVERLFEEWEASAAADPLPLPFVADLMPIRLSVEARKIPAWQLDRLNMVGKLQPSPARSDESVESITLVPMGAARLRIAAFPTVSTKPDAHEWTTPAKPKPSAYKASASHCHEGDSLEALGDGLEPADSNDYSVPRFTWWSHKGSTEWVQYDFEKSRKISSASVYWFDDTGAGQCRVPQSWRLVYRVGNDWMAVLFTGEFGVKKDAWNVVNFPAVEADAIRIGVQLQPEFSGGILEWKIGESENETGKRAHFRQED